MSTLNSSTELSGARSGNLSSHGAGMAIIIISNKVIIFRILLEELPLHLSWNTLSGKLPVLLLKSGLYHTKAAQLEVVP